MADDEHVRFDLGGILPKGLNTVHDDTGEAEPLIRIEVDD